MAPVSDGRTISGAPALLVAGALLAAIGLGFVGVNGVSGTLIALEVAGVALMLAIFMFESVGKPAERAVPVVPWLLVLALPLVGLFARSDVAILVVQMAAAGAVLWLLMGASTEELELVKASCQQLAVPGAVLTGLFVLAWINSGLGGAPGAEFAASLMLSTVFLALPALLLARARRVDWQTRVAWAALALALAGLLQLPLVIAQSHGMLSGLSGTFSELAAGGATSGEGVGRYWGSLGDYELLAEYAMIVMLLGAAVTVVSRKMSLRVLGSVAALGALATGLLTSTRGFVVGAAIGLVVLTLVLLSGGVAGTARRVLQIPLLILLLAGVVLAVLPSQVWQGNLARWTEPLVGPDAFNRGLMFTAWMRLAAQSPVFGYGSQMLAVIRNGFMDYLVASPHSLYFWVVLSAGVPALLAFLWVLGVIVFRSLRAAFRGDPALRPWAAVFVAVLVAWLANESKIDATRQLPYLDWLMFIVGLSLAVSAAALKPRTEISGPHAAKAGGSR